MPGGGGGGVKQLRIATSPLRANGRPWYLGPLGMLEPSRPYFECAELKNQGFGPPPGFCLPIDRQMPPPPPRFDTHPPTHPPTHPRTQLRHAIQKTKFFTEVNNHYTNDNAS